MAAQTQPKVPKAELIPYSTLFPHGEAEKAAQRVGEEIAEHRKQLERLRLFSSENADLLSLVRRLPDHLHHDVMVPFGKAAFFPGRIVHTNEFLVLLGEGHYADLTAKQTAGVLRRRGEALESKMEGLRANIADLKARAEFFDATAGDSAEGIVEIREFEEPLKDDAGLVNPGSEVSSEKATVKDTITDEEYTRILAVLDEHEKAELATESILNEDEEDHSETRIKSYHHTDDFQTTTTTTKVQTTKGLESAYMDSRMSSIERGGAASGTHPPSSTLKSFKCASEDTTVVQSQRKAFTGVVVEHGDRSGSISSSSTSSQATTAKSSKPVSRFKMQRSH